MYCLHKACLFISSEHSHWFFMLPFNQHICFLFIMNSRDKLFMWRHNHSSINACFYGSYLYSPCICVVWLLVYSTSFIIWTLSYTIWLFTVFNAIVLWMFAVFCFAWRSFSVVLLAKFMLVYLSITCNKLACTSVRSSVFSRKLKS